MADNRVIPPQGPRLRAYEALRVGAERAVQEIERLGGMEQFRKPGEHRATVRTEPLPRPSMSGREYLKRFPLR